MKSKTIILIFLLLAFSNDITFSHFFLNYPTKEDSEYLDNSYLEDFQDVTRIKNNYFSEVLNLPKGEYLINWDESSNSVWAISVSTREKYFITGEYGKIGSLVGGYLLRIDEYEDFNQLNYFNIVSGVTFTFITNTDENCFCLTSAYDLGYIAKICPDENWKYFIQVDKISDKSTITLDLFEQNENLFTGFYWSPDGNYLAYHMRGLMLVETDCFEEPETCNTKISGPYMGPMNETYVWSPDSQKLATVSSQKKSVYIFFVDSRRFQKAFDVMEGVLALAWSQDGKGLYYTTGEYYSQNNPGEIRYHDLETGDDSFFSESGLVLFTLTVE